LVVRKKRTIGYLLRLRINLGMIGKHGNVNRDVMLPHFQ